MELTSPRPSKGDAPITITITFPTNAYFMSGIRDFTFSMIKNMTQFSEQWAYRFQSIVDELCNNAIEHGSAPMRDVSVIFTYTPEESLEIFVSDSGSGPSKMKAADIEKYIAERRNPSYTSTDLRGRGLSRIVTEWTDELHFKDLEGGGLQVRAKKNLDRQESVPDAFENEHNPTRIMLNV